MKTSRVAIFDAPDRPFRLESVAVPSPGTGEVLIRIECTTLCRSDLYTYTGKRTEKTPTILGHEIVGRIAAIGPDTPETDCRGAVLRPGDRVTWAIYASDPCSCMARAGIPQKAPDLFKYGHEPITPASHLHGGLADYCLLRRNTPILRIDADIPTAVLALINCSFATVAGALRMAGPVQDRNVLITGAGMLGLVAGAMCHSAGARHVIAADIANNRLQVARDFGFDTTLLLGSGQPSLKTALGQALPGEPLHVAIDCSGVPDTMEAMMETLGIGGTAVLIGAVFSQRPLALNAERIVRNIQTLRGLHNYNTDDFIAAVTFLEANHARYPFQQLVQEGFGLEDVDAAFRHALHSGVHRVAIHTNPTANPSAPDRPGNVKES
jgi:putative phosphonate catabolism associated alcohol dehydrogenase